MNPKVKSSDLVSQQLLRDCEPEYEDRTRCDPGGWGDIFESARRVKTFSSIVALLSSCLQTRSVGVIPSLSRQHKVLQEACLNHKPEFIGFMFPAALTPPLSTRPRGSVLDLGRAHPCAGPRVQALPFGFLVYVFSSQNPIDSQTVTLWGTLRLHRALEGILGRQLKKRCFER